MKLALGLLAMMSNPVDIVRCANELPEDGGQVCLITFKNPDDSKMINLRINWTDGTHFTTSTKRTSIQLAQKGQTLKSVSAGGFSKIPTAVAFDDLHAGINNAQ